MEGMSASEDYGVLEGPVAIPLWILKDNYTEKFTKLIPECSTSETQEPIPLVF
jgi:hypothetical protein